MATATRRPLPYAPRAFRPLPEGASIEQILHALQEMASAYATIASGYTFHLPLLATEVDEIRAEVLVLGSDLRRLTSRFDKFAPPASSLPPMRPPTESTHDLAKMLGHEVAQRIDAEARDPTTPPPSAETIEGIVSERVAIELIRIKASNWERIEKERNDAELDRVELAKLNARERLRVRWAAIAGATTTVLALAAWIVEHFLR
jgi:hypothetical protein